MDFTQIMKNIMQWVWQLINDIGQLVNFMFTPLSETIQNMTLPAWVSTALGWLVGLFGNNISPIIMLGIGGIIVAVIVSVVKLFV